MSIRTGLSICALMAAVALWSSCANDGAAPPKWGPATNDCQMSIELSGGTNIVKQHSPINLSVAIKNGYSNETITVIDAVAPNSDPRLGVYCSVITPSGKNAPLSRTNSWDGDGSAFLRSVAATKIEVFEFKLGEVCRFDEIGDYKIVATKTVMVGTNKHIQLISNPLTISVKK